jgi:hypothetical protein
VCIRSLLPLLVLLLRLAGWGAAARLLGGWIGAASIACCWCCWCCRGAHCLLLRGGSAARLAPLRWLLRLRLRLTPAPAGRAAAAAT